MLALASPSSPFALALPLASGLVYVAAALFLKRATEAGANVWRTTRVCNSLTAVFFLPLLFLGGKVPSLSQCWQPALVAFFFSFGQVLTMYALRVGDVSVATPVLGLKIIFVPFLVSAILGEHVPHRLWIAAALSTVGIALLHFGRPRAGGRVGATICIAMLAAAAYALFDVFVQKWAPVWGAGRFLPIMMGCAALYTWMWPLRRQATVVPASKDLQRWMFAGGACLSFQALMLVTSIAIYQHATVANVLYSSRGFWSVLIVWVAGYRLGNREGELGSRVFAWRLAGAVVLIVAIMVVFFEW